MTHIPTSKRVRTGCAFLIAPLLLASALPGWAGTATCEAHSGPQRTPVIELYTSEGCSSCPPADQWLSTLKGTPVVAQAFHVGYWDYIGWVDRFATTANTARQRDVAQRNHLNNIYTPQLVRDGQDWPNWHLSRATQATAPAAAAITVQRVAGQSDQFTARVTPVDANAAWSAYWTVTENGHASRVKAGENRDEFLQHDFVVRQYAPVGRYQGAQTLNFVTIPAQPEHPRQVNLVVHDTRTGETLQAISLSCMLGAG